MRIAILAAGVGSRLGSPYPKPLTELDDGRSIMQRQLENLAARFDPTTISIVVGYKMELIMESFPDVMFIYNQDYAETNTSRSLLKVMRLTGPEPVLWLNGDVVFEPELLDSFRDQLRDDRSFVAVNTASVGEEEVKYDLDDEGFIRLLSKEVPDPLGEAVGINYVSVADKSSLVRALEDCRPHDYFERGVELSIMRDGRRYEAVDVSTSLCIEVDFISDLARANKEIVGRSSIHPIRARS
jgi:choline kinase